MTRVHSRVSDTQSPDLPRYLWVTGEVISRPSMGIYVYSSGVIEALATRASVTVVGLAKEGTELPTRSSAHWIAVEGSQRPSALSLLHPLPHMSFVIATRSFRSALRRLLRESDWDAILFDHLRSTWVLPELRRAGVSCPVVYVSQNVETVTRDDVYRVERRPLLRLVRRYEGEKIARLERRALRACDLVTAITPADRAEFEAMSPKGKVIELPPGYSGRRVEEREIGASTPRQVALLGNLLWPEA